MTNDSTENCTVKEIHHTTKSPRVSTVNFIRQFSRAYVAVSGIDLNQMVCN